MNNIAIMYDNNVVYYNGIVTSITIMTYTFSFVIVSMLANLIYRIKELDRSNRHIDNRNALLAWVKHTRIPNKKPDESNQYVNAKITVYPNYRTQSVYLLTYSCYLLLPFTIFSSMTTSRNSPSFINVAWQDTGFVIIMIAIVIMGFIGALLLLHFNYRQDLVCTKKAISVKRPGKTQSIISWNETLLCTKKTVTLLRISLLSYDLYEISDNSTTMSFARIYPRIMRPSLFASKIPIQEYEQEIQRIISYITDKNRCPFYDLDKVQFAYPDLNEVRNKPHPIAQQRKRRRAVDRIQGKEYMVPSQNDDI